MPVLGPAILIVAVAAGVGELVFAGGAASGVSNAENTVADGLAVAAALGGIALIVYAHKKGAA